MLLVLSLKKINKHTSLALEQVNLYLQSSVDFIFLFIFVQSLKTI
jgi:hypothetical protein